MTMTALEKQVDLRQRYLFAGLLFEAKLALFRDKFVRRKHTINF